MKYITAFLWLFIAASCASYSGLVPAPGVALAPGTKDDCAASCVKRRALGCADGAPTPAGATCETVCLNTEASGYASENPACLAKMNSCDDEAACANPQQ